MTDPEGDPTEDFLDQVRTGETPWRTERPVDAEASPESDRQQRSGRWNKVGRAVGEAAPYVQAALFAAWIATSIADSGDWSTDQSG
ncbi:hypothetical protein [Amycolatopsis sp. NPDC051903]|uniref:hypothetical protein n=1 Tax=Amycolatopsis sp. NPDC051903 TaxID=3363936 RepID=UPI0037B071D4